METKELDKKDMQNNKVQVRIVLPNAKAYLAHAEAFKALTDQAGGTMAVKMVCK